MYAILCIILNCFISSLPLKSGELFPKLKHRILQAPLPSAHPELLILALFKSCMSWMLGEDYDRRKSDTLFYRVMVAMLKVKNHPDFREGMITFFFNLLKYISLKMRPVSTIHSIIEDL